MESLSIKTTIFLLGIIPFFAACDSNEKTQNMYIDKCAMNSFLFIEKKDKVIKKLDKIGVLKDYFVLKHGAASEPFYSFSLIGLKGNEGVFLYLDDSLIEPISIKIGYDVAVELINTGKLVFSEDNIDNFYTKGVNGIPCYFINFDKEGVNKSIAYAGRSKASSITSFFRRVEALAFNLERIKGNNDNKPKISRDVSHLSVKNIFDELKEK